MDVIKGHCDIGACFFPQTEHTCSLPAAARDFQAFSSGQSHQSFHSIKMSQEQVVGQNFALRMAEDFWGLNLTPNLQVCASIFTMTHLHDELFT